MPPQSYPLKTLLSVRLYREDAARTALRLEERRLAHAREDAARRQEELERYRRWRQEEEERRYAAVMGACLSLEDVAEFRTALGVLVAGEQERLQAVRQAEEQVMRQEQAVTVAQKAVAQARRDAARIETHHEIWKTGVRREQERHEDLELEEFATPSPVADEV